MESFRLVNCCVRRVYKSTLAHSSCPLPSHVPTAADAGSGTVHRYTMRLCIRPYATTGVPTSQSPRSPPAIPGRCHTLCMSPPLSSPQRFASNTSMLPPTEIGTFDVTTSPPGVLPRTATEIKRWWPNTYDTKYPPLDQLERDMQHINSQVTTGKLPLSHLLLIVEMWAVYQRGPYAPLSPRIFNNVIYAYSKLNAHMLAIQLYLAFPSVAWKSMANEAIKRSALQMAHPDAYVEALQRQEASGKPTSRHDLEGLAVVCIRAREFSRALAVLGQLEQMPGSLSPRVYKEMVISALAVGDCDRAARACMGLAEALYSQEKELAAAVDECMASSPKSKPVAERKWPEWLAKCLRIPEKVINQCLRNEDAESCLAAVQALQLLGMHLHKDLADRTLEFAVSFGSALLAELAFRDIMQHHTPAENHYRLLARAYANAEDVQGALRVIQCLHVSGSESCWDDAAWDAVNHAIVCVNNRVFLAGKQLKAKMPEPAPEPDTEDFIGVNAAEISTEAEEGELRDTVTVADSMPPMAESDAPAQLVSEHSAAASARGDAQSLLGFGLASAVGEGTLANSGLSSATDLLLPERRRNRWGLYFQAASLNVGIPEIALSFAANAAEDISQYGDSFFGMLSTHHDNLIRARRHQLAQNSMDSVPVRNPTLTFSDSLSEERERVVGNVMRGRTIEEVLQANLMSCDKWQESRGDGGLPSPRIATPVINLILGALPRCRAGAFVAPTFHQLIMAYNLAPDADTYAALLVTFVEPPFFNVSKAQEILTSMEEVGIKPNGRLYGSLASLLARVQKFDKALKVLDDAISKDGARPPPETFRSIIRCISIHRDATDDAKGYVQEVLRLARACGVPLGREFEMGYISRHLFKGSPTE